jgi:ferritin
MKNSLLSKQELNKIEDAAQRELTASNLYKHIANQMQSIGYFGSQKFFLGESSDELIHYQLWADFVNDRGSVLDVPSVKGSTESLTTLLEAFELYFEMEKELGEFYNDWYMSTKDASIHQRLIQYVEIQTKSIGEAFDYLATLNQCGTDKAALLVFDKETFEN